MGDEDAFSQSSDVDRSASFLPPGGVDKSRDLEIFNEFKVEKPKPAVVSFPVSGLTKHLPDGTIIKQTEVDRVELHLGDSDNAATVN